MFQISLTDFVDIVSASGTPKATKVRQIRRRPAYNPAFDFYRPLRESIIESHQLENGKTSIDNVMKTLSDQKRRVYPHIINGYKRWKGRKSFVWFDPPSDYYAYNDVSIIINPELGLEINSTPHLIKLYFKKDPLAKNKMDIITHLMKITVASNCKPSTVMSVLDVRQGKLFSPTVPIDGLTSILNAELAYIASLLDQA